MAESQFRALEQKIDELIRLCADLNRENVHLKAEARMWAQERQALLSRNETAKVQVESILSRLKAVEQAR